MSQTNGHTNGYEEFIEVFVPANEAVARLTVLVAEAREKEIELATIAAQLKTAMEQHRSLVSVQIPALMKELGMQEIKLSSGLKVEIKDDIQCGISEERRPAAHKWLVDNDHGGIITREVIVSFNKEQAPEAIKLMEELRTKFAAVTSKEAVHPSTLKAFVKAQLAEGKPVPVETFAVFEQKVAKFSETRK